jgi:multidrug efflux pump subunit AcrA (membrane-fusion protein)
MVSRGALLVALLTLLLAACTADERPLVQVEPVGSGEVSATVSAPARVDPAARQDVAAGVSGVVVALTAADGDQVQQGQAVVTLESSQVELAQQQAAAAQEAAGQVGGISLDSSSSAADVAQEAVAQLDRESRPALDEARHRAEELIDPAQRAAAEASIAAIESTYANTRAVLLATAQAAAEERAELSQALEDALNQAVLQATAAQRAQAEAAATLAAQQQAGLSVIAPFAGTISLGDAAATDGGAAALSGLAAGGGVPADLEGLAGALPGLAGGEGGGTLRIGAPVTAGQTLFTVFDLSTRYVLAEVDEVDAPAVVAGQEATVFIDAFPDTTFQGVVESIAVEAEPTQTGGVGYPTRVRLTGADADVLGSTRVGQTASAEIVTETTEADLVVPSRALVRREGGTAVFLLRDGRAELVEVTVDILGEDRAAVTGDLDEGDEVIVTGYENLVDGTEVRIS